MDNLETGAVLKVLSVTEGVATVELDAHDLYFLLHQDLIYSRTARRRFLNRFRKLHRETAESRIELLSEMYIVSALAESGWRT